MTGYVVDASFLVATLVVEAETTAARQLMDDVQVRGAVGPPHLPHEVVNALTMKLRRKQIDAAYRAVAIDTFFAYEVRIDRHTDALSVFQRTVGLADRHGLTIYDAAYLELAQREILTLATLDRPLSKAARREGVAVALT